MSVQTADDFARFAKHENPFVRHRALMLAAYAAQKDPRPFVTLLIPLLSDKRAPNRALAADGLGRTGEPSAVPPLEQRLRDEPDRTARQKAAVALARLGKMPDLKWFQGLLVQHEREHGLGNIEVYQALAPHATAEVFALLLQYPLTTDDYEPRQAIFQTLGGSLRKHPEAAQVLLKAYAADDPGPESNYGPARFAQEVFKFAGQDLVPALHQSLQSPDRIVRSNAARACGAIGEAASVPHLLRALDLESGLSRASIVWALGQLRAKEALPRLASLYVDARNDEKRARGAGFRIAQAQAEVRAQYDHLANLEAISSEWDELQQAARPEPIDPKRREPLLATAGILAAVRKIGPESSQAFYRQLAAERDSEARHEAAARLAESSPGDRPQNLPVLRNLLADEHVPVRIAAAVSLFILGERDVQAAILGWLESSEVWQADETLRQLERVRDGGSLVFARAAIQRLADQPARRAYGDNLAQRLLQRIPK